MLFGIPFIFINTSVLSLAAHPDKANASSVLNLIEESKNEVDYNMSIKFSIS